MLHYGRQVLLWTSNGGEIAEYEAAKINSSPKGRRLTEITAGSASLSFDLFEERPTDRKRRWTAFGISSLIQPIVVGLAAWVLAAVPQQLPQVKSNRIYFEVALSPLPKVNTPKILKPPPVWRLPAARIAPKPAEVEAPPPVTARVVVAPEPIKTLPDHAPIPIPNTLSAAPTSLPKRELPPVRTGLFSGSIANATLKRPAREVQTGGFGDVNGLPGDAAGGSRGNVAKLGAFDLPSGPGYGNGSGGARGARGTVVSAGFGNGIAGAGDGVSGGSSGKRNVQVSGFGDQSSAAPAPVKRAVAAPTSDLKPVEILSKPNPVYTEEARRQRVEGEVLLEVVFAASGELRVLRVIAGLGHGLDEAATRAAERIVFKPARRDGQPVDSRATLHIVFQLAY